MHTTDPPRRERLQTKTASEVVGRVLQASGEDGNLIANGVMPEHEKEQERLKNLIRAMQAR